MFATSRGLRLTVEALEEQHLSSYAGLVEMIVSGRLRGDTGDENLAPAPATERLQFAIFQT